MQDINTPSNDEAHHALPSTVAKQLLLQEMKAQNLRHVDLAKRLGNTRQLMQRLLDPEYVTKIDTITLEARRRAAWTSATWPAWSAPMVGTSAMRSPAARQSRTWRRSEAGLDARFSPSAFIAATPDPNRCTAHCARAANLAKEKAESIGFRAGLRASLPGRRADPIFAGGLQQTAAERAHPLGPGGEGARDQGGVTLSSFLPLTTPLPLSGTHKGEGRR